VCKRRKEGEKMEDGRRGLRPLEERFRLRSSSYAGTRRPDKSLEVRGKRENGCLVKVGTVADS
jgi:hypothetical protein